MLGLIFLTLVSFVSEAVGQMCAGETYYFHYDSSGSQVLKFIDRCTYAKTLSGCDKVQQVVTKYHPRLGVRPFDEFAKAYVSCFVRLIMKKNEPKWIALYGKKPELQHERYKSHRLRALITDMEYEVPKTLSTNVDSLLVKTFSNAQSGEEISGEISEEIAKVVETVTSRQHAWNVGASVEVGASDLFKIASVSVEVSAEYSGSSATEVSKTSSRTYSISDTIKVPAGKTVRVVWTMTEANIEIAWTSKMQISGTMAASVDGVLYFFPVGHMALVYDDYFRRVSTHAISLEGKGKFYTTTSLQAAAHISQFPLGEAPACFS